MPASGGRNTGAKIGKLVVLSLLVFIVAAFGIAQPVSAAQRCVLEDPLGDWSGLFVGEAYQDFVGASLMKKDGRFILVSDMAGPFPESPPLPTGAKLLMWTWTIDPNPDTAPVGFPLPPGQAHHAEIHVIVLWDGAVFTGILVDRRPLLTGGDAIITSVPFSFKGARLTASVDAAAIGDPSTFTWGGGSFHWTADLGTDSFFSYDFLPAGTWPC